MVCPFLTKYPSCARPLFRPFASVPPYLTFQLKRRAVFPFHMYIMDNTVIPKWFASPIRNTLWWSSWLTCPFITKISVLAHCCHFLNLTLAFWFSAFIFRPFAFSLPYVAVLLCISPLHLLPAIPAENSCRIPVHKQPWSRTFACFICI